VVDDLRDYAAVYLDHKLQGTLDRRLRQTQLDISVPPGMVTLGILVENTGRNIGPQQSLFLPGAWLKKGLNEVVVFDFNDLDGPRLGGVGDPIWSK
jgi:hypothetical protein